MFLGEIVEALDLSVECGEGDLKKEVKGGYTSDLLSDVMAHASDGYLWVTIQTHQNIVAVAALLNLAGIIITGGGKPNEDTLKKAKEEGVVLITTPGSSFDICGRLYAMGVRGGPPRDA